MKFQAYTANAEGDGVKVGPALKSLSAVTNIAVNMVTSGNADSVTIGNSDGLSVMRVYRTPVGFSVKELS